MLQLSANGDYGLLLLLELAKQPAGTYISLAKLSRDKQLPRRFLDQVARQLVAASIIKAREGRGGGYTLKKNPKSIKFITVLNALEGDIKPADCAIGCGYCSRQSACEKKTGWRTVHKEIYNLLKNKTLAEVLAPALNP